MSERVDELSLGVAAADREYERTFPYVKNTLKIKGLSHIANEKAILNLYTEYRSKRRVVNVDCSDGER